MKKLIALFLCIVVSLTCSAQKKSIDSLFYKDAQECKSLTIEGLKDIRHDAIIRCKFRYAHYLKLEIKKEENE